jgi:hypothetical protein
MFPALDTDLILQCYKKYMAYAVETPPTSNQFLLNIENKILDTDFTGDLTALLRPTEVYLLNKAYDLIKTKLIIKI